jgi:competence protein ComEA
MKWQFKFDEFIKRYKLAISLVLILIILGSAGVLLVSAKQGGVRIIDPDEGKGGAICKVDIEGAIKHPGVYNLCPDDRVEDAIRVAGGPLPDADLSKVSKSLAARVADEERILVPFRSGSSSSESSESTHVEGKVNINTASLSQLDTLPGIGPATAQKIIDHREENGPFASIEDVMDVSGIGEVKFEKMKDLITI